VFNAENQQDLMTASENLQELLTYEGEEVEPEPYDYEEVAWTPFEGLNKSVMNPALEPNLYVPVVAAAPENRAYQNSVGQLHTTRVKTIKRFIDLVKNEEKSNRNSQFRSNTKSMITRFRRIFYNGDLWDNVIIPETHNDSISGPTMFKHDSQGGLLKKLSPPYLFNRTGRYTPEIYQAQEVKEVPINSTGGLVSPVGAAGNYIDMGHVLAAMDAVNNPSATPPPNHWSVRFLVPSSELARQVIKVDSNIDNATWVGDLGGIIAQAVRKAKQNAPDENFDFSNTVSAREMQALINDDAEPQDMLGDIDGLVISYNFRDQISKTTGGLKVSQILTSYYSDKGGMKSRRFSTFAQIVGLGSLETSGKFTGGRSVFNQGAWFGGTNQFANEEEWVDYYSRQVVQSAMQFVIGFTRDAMATRVAAQQIDLAKVLLRRFLNTLKVHIKKEPRS
jgi:hypothetical protein